jgi:hypothetical protein
MAYALWQIPIISNISDRLFIYWIPYAILGILLYRNINYFKQFANAYVVILSLMLIPLEFIVLDYYKFIHSPYVLPTVLIASVLISIYFIVHNNLIASYMSEQVKNLSVYISKRTLGIFVLNPYFIFLLKPYITLENSYMQSIEIVLFAITVFCLSLLSVWILEKTFFKKLVVN